MTEMQSDDANKRRDAMKIGSYVDICHLKSHLIDGRTLDTSYGRCMSTKSSRRWVDSFGIPASLGRRRAG